MIDFSMLIDKFPKVFETYWNNKWKRSNLHYVSKGDGQLLPVIDSFGNGSPELLNVADTLSRIYDRDWDDLAFGCFKFVRSFVDYKSDKVTQGVPEYWQDPNETFASGEGDCEDGALLLMKLMELSGVPAWRRKVCAGWVKDPTFGDAYVGHAYVIYLNKYFQWMVLDWCFHSERCVARWYSNTPHHECPEYKDIWFCFNEQWSWIQKNTIITHI